MGGEGGVERKVFLYQMIAYVLAADCRNLKSS